MPVGDWVQHRGALGPERDGAKRDDGSDSKQKRPRALNVMPPNSYGVTYTDAPDPDSRLLLCHLEDIPARRVSTSEEL